LELADGGTVFLDEFSEMGVAPQSKLLRFLEEKSFKRLGSALDVQVDVRVVAASNRNLDEAVQRAQLRKDLYYRLRVFPVHLPPRRERRGDIALLAAHFIDLFNREFRKRVEGLSPESLRMLESHHWDGNVRELKNAIERAMLFADGPRLAPGDFSILSPRSSLDAPFVLPPEGINLDQLERSLVTQALKRADGNRTRAGALLGMTRDRMRYRIEKFDLE
jgi:transcriptional regulator with PAS, ATPase and Fis domain